ncbi:MAG: restriction endonuclease subunit S [Verrucomicrobiota bacterium]
MEVKPGYKQTEVGVIPEEWDVEPCRRVSKFITVGIVVKPTQYYQKHGVPALRSANVRENQIDKSDLIFISEKANAQQAKSQVRAGDVVTVRTGYPGTSAVVPTDMAGSNCIDILITRPTDRLDSTFLSAWINSPRGKDQVLRSQNGLAQQHFNVGELRELLVALPPLPEQRAIAEALSDVDGLLGRLDRLIAKKRYLKQAAMQQLLTGQTRLPGFDGDWRVKRLDRIAPLQRGFDLPNRELRSGPFPVVYSNGILNHHSDWQVEGPGVVTGRSGTIGNVTFIEGKYWPHNTALWVTSFKGNDPSFIFYLYTRIDFERFATGSGVPTLNRNDVHSFEVLIAPTKAEQTAIADVLTDMDAEIAALEQRREKTRALKQAMMQELLTGKTRLI